MKRQCVASSPARTYKDRATRCEKKAKAQPLQGLRLCAHHVRVAERGNLAVWNPAVEPKR